MALSMPQIIAGAWPCQPAEAGREICTASPAPGASLGLAAAAFAATDGTATEKKAEEHSHRGMQHGRMGANEGKGPHGPMASASPEQRRQLAQNMHAQRHGSATGGEHRHEQQEGNDRHGNNRRGPQAEKHQH